MIHLGEAEIWNGENLAMLRGLFQHMQHPSTTKVGVNLAYVKYLPSGFFGLLYEWHDCGMEIHLYTPQPCVTQMLWFQECFQQVAENDYQLIHQTTPELIQV